ncbi:MAG: glycosyl hydrolase [bacterium]
MESRPWTYWWWMGSAVEKSELEKNLEVLSKAGLGGVHIIPIYGVKGYEDLYIDYLSSEWISMFSFTKKEARRLGMGVDMSAGTGWPFGGPQIRPIHAAKTFDLKKRGSGYELEVENTGQKVKRAAPGGHGLVMDYYCRDALDTYLSRFDQAFAGTDARPRSFYNDSFEVYGADWTDDLFQEFRKRRGYDLREHLAALDGKVDKEYVSRVLCDYRETVSDLLFFEFARPWTEWAHKQGALTRNQAHGSPGNLLDLYAAADIPETEAFGPSHFDIPGLDYYKSLAEHHGKPDVLVMKFAGSAAHVTGKRLVSSESCTWLGEHFTVSLAHVKPEIDKLWAGGINHVFFHGITYSPDYEDWPGWLFYAPTNFGPSNTWFRDLPALNAYIARTQSFLQSGAPDNDILLYWPAHDLWSGVYDEDPLQKFRETTAEAWRRLFSGRPGEFADLLQSAAVELYESRQSKAKLFTVHNADEWLHDTAFGKAARKFKDNGYSFDYISDRMIAELSYNGAIESQGGASYRAIVVPRVRYMPVSTQEKLSRLSRQGARIVYMNGFPQDVPGLARLEKRRERLQKAIEGLDGNNVASGSDLSSMLSEAGVEREPMVDRGLSFVRRSHEAGHYYFITNPGPGKTEGWVSLGSGARSAVIFDTLHKKSGRAAMKRGGDSSRVYLKLEPGQSLVLKTFTNKPVQAREWQYFGPAEEALNIKGTWQIEFIKGGPRLPASYETKELESWTQRPGRDYKYFSGTARYSAEFHVPKDAGSRDWTLDLGEVRESARVFINGEEAGVVFCHPYKLRVGEYLHAGANRLAIEVTNLPANRIIYLDRHLKRWKKFRDINFVNVNYLPFNAAGWRPFRSGLIGPVRLRPGEGPTYSGPRSP